VLWAFALQTALLTGPAGSLTKLVTMDEVRTLAGYADTSNYERGRAVISLMSNDGAMRYRLLKAIGSGL
jgi:D-alanyl-D-alanine carboxypeptidase/D-alanyl-D-alanine-endopeptidase (penicillin-binding protein 4)